MLELLIMNHIAVMGTQICNVVTEKELGITQWNATQDPIS